MLAYDHWNLSERCLESILENSAVLRYLTVVDNGSTDDTPRRLHAYVDRFAHASIRLKIVRLEQNIGFAKGMNAGLESTLNDPEGEFDYFAVISNDTYLMQAWDRALIEAQKRHQVDVISPFPIETPFQASTPEFLIEFSRRNQKRFRRQLSMIVALFTRNVINEMGLFDPQFFVGYEDFDLKHRLDLGGRRYLVTGNSVVWHQSKGTRGEDVQIEYQGLEIFQSKWGFDPRKLDYTPAARMKRLYRRLKTRFGRV